MILAVLYKEGQHQRWEDLITMVALLIHPSDGKDLKKGSDGKKEREEQHRETHQGGSFLRTLPLLAVVQGREEEGKTAFLFLTWVIEWVLLREIWEKTSVMAKLFSFRGVGGSDKKIFHFNYPKV